MPNADEEQVAVGIERIHDAHRVVVHVLKVRKELIAEERMIPPQQDVDYLAVWGDPLAAQEEVLFQREDRLQSVLSAVGRTSLLRGPRSTRPACRRSESSHHAQPDASMMQTW